MLLKSIKYFMNIAEVDFHISSHLFFSIRLPFKRKLSMCLLCFFVTNLFVSWVIQKRTVISKDVVQAILYVSNKLKKGL